VFAGGLLHANQQMAPNRSKMAATTGSRSLLASAPSSLASAVVKGSLEGNPVHVLIDSGAREFCRH